MHTVRPPTRPRPVSHFVHQATLDRIATTAVRVCVGARCTIFPARVLVPVVLSYGRRSYLSVFYQTGPERMPRRLCHSASRDGL